MEVLNLVASPVTHALQAHLTGSGGTEGDPFPVRDWKALLGLAEAEEPATGSQARKWLREDVSKRE
ncbi:hypothetical protein AN478_07060 [Thiohalorhabdus denitrificans]|nr:hypothetical protein AN478_07060 [Thiohalorhabdus denitrificans]